MIQDLILDTHILTEFIAQYYENKIFQSGLCVTKQKLTKLRCLRLNQIITEYRNENSFSKGLIITSSLSFVEISRKFSEISQNRYTLQQFRSFLEQPPPYFHIAPIEKNLSFYLHTIPKIVLDNEGHSLNIEVADAIHCATYLTRDSAIFFTDDSKIKAIGNYDILS